jgi:hypothetical protein
MDRRRPPWNVPDQPGPGELPTLDALEAFDVMRSFLENYWDEGGQAEDQLLRLLSSIERDSSICADGGPTDQGQWDRWVEAVRYIKRG